MTTVKEKELYPRVEKWLKNRFPCFATAVNTGLSYSRPDVIGVCDIGGDLSGEVETIIVEVKRGREPFATASGQTLGYKVYANRVYLADYRSEPFNQIEMHIASQLGIGLIQIKGAKCIECLSSPYHKPITRLNLSLLEKLHLGNCQMCGSLFDLGKRWKNVAREDIHKAIQEEKGLMFWNREVSERKKKNGMRMIKSGGTVERRYFCPDCVASVLAELDPYEEE